MPKVIGFIVKKDTTLSRQGLGNRELRLTGGSTFQFWEDDAQICLLAFPVGPGKSACSSSELPLPSSFWGVLIPQDGQQNTM